MNICIDCQRKINKTSTRCKSCACKGKLHHNYKDGRTNKKHYCKNCGKELINIYAIRCRSCASKLKSQEQPIGKKGKLHPKWKGGKPKCLDCGKQLSNYRTKRCKICANIGINNVNWKGGLSKLPYAPNWTGKLKNLIRNRDNYTCQLCHKKGNTVHHIDYNKKNCKENNLITLCISCNSKVNFNRDYWFAYFTYLMEHRNVL